MSQINLSEIDTENFCIAPWVNVHMTLDGAFKPCCGGNSRLSYIADEGIEYLRDNNQQLLKLRDRLLQNTKSEYCSKCQEKPWYDSLKSKPIWIKQVNETALRSIDIRWSNTCNLTCMYCDSFNSSKWNEKLKGDTPGDKPRKFTEQYDNLYLFIEENKHNIQRVNLVGGEPLLINENIKLLEMLPDSIQIEIITNLTVDLETNKIFNNLIKRDNVQWYVSMENVGRRFEFVRRGADWNTQVKNLQLLASKIKDQPGSVLDLHAIYNAYTALHLDEFYAFARSIEQARVSWTVLYEPWQLNFLNFPKSYKLRSLEQIEFCKETYNAHELRRVTEPLAASMGTEKDNIVADCIKFNADYEHKYFNNKFNFLELWPEFS